jgi:hypothetical protein
MEVKPVPMWAMEQIQAFGFVNLTNRIITKKDIKFQEKQVREIEESAAKENLDPMQYMQKYKISLIPHY